MSVFHAHRTVRTLTALGSGLLTAITFACAAREVLPTLSDRPLSRAEAETAEEAYQRGLDLAQTGRYEAALVEFTQVVDQYPSSSFSALALYWQGRSYYQVGNDSAAARTLERYVGLAPDVPNREHAILLRANSHYGLTQYDQALSAALDVEQASAERLDDFVGLARDLLERLPRSTVENAARLDPDRNWMAPFYLQAARWAFDAGDTDRGRALARRVVEFAELPVPVLADARALAGGGSVARPRLGFIVPAEGRFADVSEEIRRGIELALVDINRTRAAPFELVSRSTPNDPDSTAAIIRTLARGERVLAVLGPLTSEIALSAGQAAREEGVALVSPTATDARMLEIGPKIFTVNALDGAIGHTIGTYAANNLGRERFAILAVDNVYGRVQADAFAQAVEATGARVVYRHVYEPNTTQFTDRLGEIVRAGADAVFVATKSPNEALRILNQLAFFELHGLLPLGTDAWNDESFLQQGRRFIRGYFADTFSRDPRVTQWQTFAENYAARYGQEPQNLIPAWGYDAARLALEWFQGAPGPSARASTQSGRGPRSERAQRGERTDRTYLGASALYRWTPTGTRRAVVVHQIEGGEPVAVEW